MNGQIPFRVAIVTIVVGLLALTCGALITYFLYASQRNAGIIKREYLDQVAQATVREVARLPRSAAQMLRAERHRFENGYYAAQDAMALAGRLASALELDPDIRWVSYGEASGRFMGAYRLEGEEIILNVSDPARNGGVPREFRARTRAPHVQNPPLDKPYDPRKREWYQRAATTPDAVWMPPYLFAEGVTGITVAVAVRDSAYRLQGVVTVDFTLEGIARFLETVEIVQGGAVALFERDGKLLAGKPGPGRDAATRAMQGAESEVVREGIGTALVRFTGVDWDTQARIEAFARAR